LDLEKKEAYDKARKEKEVKDMEEAQKAESDEDSEELTGVRAGSQPEMPVGDWATWSLALEVGRLQESSERMETLLQSLVDQVKSGADLLELFMQGIISCGHRQWGNWRGQRRWRQS